MFGNPILRPALPRHGPHYECGALLTSATEECLARKRLTKYAERTPHSRRSGNLKWCSREDSHLEPPPSQSGVQNSYTSGAKMVRHAGAAPAPGSPADRPPLFPSSSSAVWKTAVLAVTPMMRMKMVAASGIAPDSPRLQRGADLSQLHSQWSLRAVSRRGLSVIGRLLCF